MFNRRKFISRSFLSSFAVALGLEQASCQNANTSTEKKIAAPPNHSEVMLPIVIATWPNQEATAAAWEVLKQGGDALDAVEAGAKVPEADPDDRSVGYGGRPDRDGNVTLDACIMDEKGDCGSVCFLQHIKHPISVARKVMEETPHVMLAGEGALAFALSQGFEKENLLIEASKKEWKKWRKDAKYKPVINIENHDTIGILAIDKDGNISGACTTSGAAYKMQGRVGDSPIIGAGMYVDNEVGGAAATGLGEAVIKTVGSFLVVELMRQGRTPQQACQEAVMRIVNKQSDFADFQVGYIAINKKGEVGAFSIQPDFSYVVYQDEKNELYDALSYVKNQ